MELQKNQGAKMNEVGPHCGAQFTPSRLSLREMILSVVCGGELLSNIKEQQSLMSPILDLIRESKFDRNIAAESFPIN